MMTDEEWKRDKADEAKRRKKKRVWLCLDPGITTGMALLDADRELRGSTVWGTHEVKESLDATIRALHISGYSITVVIEKMPPGSYGQLAAKLEKVRQDIAMVVEETYELPVAYVAPGEWKPSRVAKTVSVKGWRFGGTPMMTHQKDAFRMGSYYIDKVQREAAASWTGKNH